MGHRHRVKYGDSSVMWLSIMAWCDPGCTALEIIRNWFEYYRTGAIVPGAPRRTTTATNTYAGNPHVMSCQTRHFRKDVLFFFCFEESIFRDTVPGYVPRQTAFTRLKNLQIQRLITDRQKYKKISLHSQCTPFSYPRPANDIPQWLSCKQSLAEQSNNTPSRAALSIHHHRPKMKTLANTSLPDLRHAAARSDTEWVPAVSLVLVPSYGLAATLGGSWVRGSVGLSCDIVSEKKGKIKKVWL